MVGNATITKVNNHNIDRYDTYEISLFNAPLCFIVNGLFKDGFRY